MGAELLHADRKTGGEADRQKDMEKPIVGFRSFVNAPKKDARVH